VTDRVLCEVGSEFYDVTLTFGHHASEADEAWQSSKQYFVFVYFFKKSGAFKIKVLTRCFHAT
jgi:hypothetical protein